MTDPRKQFDWLLFISRELPIVALAAWWMMRSIRGNNIVGAILLTGVIGPLLTTLNYLSARQKANPAQHRPE